MNTPPKAALRFFRWFCHPDLRSPIEGDLMELYYERVKESGKRKADLLFIKDILQLLRPGIVRSLKGSLKLNNYSMFKNYLKIGIRNILKHRTFSFINIFGLALAMTISLAIILLLADQTGYDQFHAKKDRIFRILTSRDGSGLNNASSPLPLGNYLKKNYPFIENSTTLLPKVGGDAIFLDGQSRKNTEVRGFFADEHFFNIFDFELKIGNPWSALNSPNNIVLTSNVAYQLFNDSNPLGKIIQLTDRGLGLIKIDMGSMKEGTPKDFGSYVVTGVIDERKYKSHIKFDVLVSSSSLDALYNQNLLKDDSQNWNRYSNGYTYVLLKESSNTSQLKTALEDVVSVNYSENETLSKLELIPQTLTEISPGIFTGNPISLSLPIEAYYILISLAVIIMLSACLNYANLSIARITSRTKEIGVRKVNGASKKNLRTQFLTESILTSFCALLLAIFILIMIQPLLDSLWFTGVFTFNLVANTEVLLAFLGFTIIVGLIAGIYPSLIVSRFTPLKALKNAVSTKANKIGLKTTLNVVQLGFSLFFIITSLLIGRQFNHFVDFDYGFNPDDLVNIPLQGNDYKTMINEFESVAGIDNISASEFVPSLMYRHGSSIRRTPDTEWLNAEKISINQNFTENLGLQLVAGEQLNPDIISFDKILVNQTFLKKLGFEDSNAAIGQEVFVNGRKNPSIIVGVVSNFNFESPFMGDGEMPLIMYHDPQEFSYLNIKVPAKGFNTTMASLQSMWEKVDPFHPFKYYRYNEQIARSNSWLRDLVSIIAFITVLSIVISCLGLLGMAVYTTERRVKEVGIRKVLGASAFQLFGLLSKSFLKVLLISICISAPLSFLVNNFWLENIPNHVSFGIGTMLSGIIILITLVFLTISSQILSVSGRNPIDSIKYE